MRYFAAAIFIAILPVSAWAVYDDEDDTPPAPTPTSTECADGTAWDAERQACVELESHLFDDTDRYRAARELAYAGRISAAEQALDAIGDQSDSKVLTYRGFLARKSGDWAAAQAYYGAALLADPDNLLARSYYGMGLAAAGDPAAARDQLAEIRARGGRETWPERALLMTLRSGPLSGY